MDELKITVGFCFFILVALLLAAPLSSKWLTVNIKEILGSVQKESVQDNSPQPAERSKSKITPLYRPLEGALPGQVRYANLQFTVTKAIINNQVPSSPINQGQKYQSDQAYAYIDLSVHNPLSTKNLSISQNLIKLQLEDEKLYYEITPPMNTTAGEGNKWRDVIGPQVTKEIRLIFPIPIHATWKGAKLVLSQPGKEPTMLPFDGLTSLAQYPVSLPVKGEATVKDTLYKILALSLDLDNQGERVEEGKLFLKLALQVTYKGKSAGGIFVDADNFRLLLQSTSLTPVEAFGELITRGGTKEGEVVFSIPASTTRVELQVGEIEQGKTAKIPLNLKPAKS